MNKFKKTLFIVVPAFIIALTAYKVLPQDLYKEDVTQTVHLSKDFAATNELSDMVNNSDLIVVGTYEGLGSIWNMARDPENPNKESSTDYVEGRLYNFEVNEILKGNSEKNIKINHRYAETIKVEETSGDEIISPEGILIKAPSNVTIHEIENVDPLFIEPELNEKYIVFLKKGETTGNYFGAIQPYLIKFDENNIASLQSNLINLDEEILTQTKVLGDQTFKISNDIHTVIVDTISNKSIDTIKQEIKDIIE